MDVAAAMDMEFRPARADDSGPIAELLYSSGTEIYDFLYGDRTLDFLRYEFASGQGIAGFRNVTVAAQGGQVVATGCFYDRSQYQVQVKDTLSNMVRFFGLGVAKVLWRSRHVGAIMHAPKPGELYLANFGVDPALRSQGIGSGLVQYRLTRARAEGYSIFGLDVMASNPRGQALYSRLGMQRIKEKTFPLKRANISNCYKMELTLVP
jgi:ribosomal protein S18 acetylase RimI-like enzyme